MPRSSTDLDMPVDGSTSYLTGLRFNDTNIPQGAQILKAYIQFTADESDSDSSQLILYGEDSDNVEYITPGKNNLSSRAKTSSKVTWSPEPWFEGDAGTAQRTPDLTNILQEIVDRSGSENNDVLFLIEGFGDDRAALSYDADPSKAAKLYVEYKI